MSLYVGKPSYLNYGHELWESIEKLEEIEVHN